ncbi:Detected protein of unknown function [Hibiscus syriacus]|uniref:WAT1-related protein n=1 Tax=Hibiscus syriacus TaxID=106335 RepID=A0A6A3CNR6_HIBSY|nr:Detected protein of unknown function [Hibiscus syriacus]
MMKCAAILTSSGVFCATVMSWWRRSRPLGGGSVVVTSEWTIWRRRPKYPHRGMATLLIAPIDFFSRRKNSASCSLGLKTFAWILLASILGVTVNQNAYFEGLYLSSSTIATAMTNLILAATFFMTAILGPGGETWFLGCLLLLASSFFWALWMVLQVPISASCPDHLYSSTWMCFFVTLEAAIVALFVERDVEAWSLNSQLELSYIRSLIIIPLHVPCSLFASMFNPLCTVIVTVFAAVFQHEEKYTGSLVGALAVIVGLYVVLWCKAKDLEKMDPKQLNDQARAVQVIIDESSEKTDLQEPLLYHKSINDDDMGIKQK